MSRFFIVFCAISCANTIPVFAESSDESVQTLETVYSEFVSAADTTPEFSVTQVTSISPEQFPAGALTASDAIEASPSVQIQRSGELGSYQSVNVRGAPSQQTQVYVDGVLQSQAGGGEGGLLQLIPLENVERIDIYPGSMPGQFATASPGGAVNIVRKSARQKSLKLSADVGSFGQGRLAAQGNTFKNATTTSAFAEWVTAQNNFPFNNSNGTLINIEDDTVEERNNAEFESLSGHINATKTTQDSESFLSLEGFSNKKNLPHWNNIEAVDTFYAQSGLTLTGGYSRNAWLGSLDSSVRLQGRWKEGHFSDPSDLIGTGANDSFDELYSVVLNHASLLPSSFGLTTLTQDITYDQFQLRDSLADVRLNAQRVATAQALGAEWFANDQWTIAGTLRANGTFDDAPDAEKTQWDWGAHLGARRETKNVVVQLNAQRSVRVPTLVERFGTQGFFVGNADLKSETAWSGDISASLKNNHYAANVTWFYRITEDTIAATFNAQSIGRYENLSSAHFWGLEWQASTNLNRLKLSSSGAWQQSVTLSDLAFNNLKQVPGYYPITTTNAAEFTFSERWQTSLSYLYESGLYWDAFNSDQSPDKHEVNAKLQYTSPSLTAEFTAKNILDRAHFDFGRRPLPGRSYLITLSYLLGDKL